jgi:hypothetical protein
MLRPMARVRPHDSNQPTRQRAAAVVLLLATVLVGCQPGVNEPPLPGSMHIQSEPPQAPESVTLRYLSPGVSGVYHEFAQGETVLVVFSSLPGEYGVQVNGQACDGRFTIETRVETDVLLVLGAGSCRLEVLGSHPEGSVHTDPPTDPTVG